MTKKLSEAMKSISELNAMLVREAKLEDELLAQHTKTALPVLASAPPLRKPRVSTMPPPPPRRSAINLSSSVGSSTPVEEAVSKPVGLPPLTPEGDGLLMNPDGHILAALNTYGRLTLSQLAEYLAWAKKEGPYARKPVSMDAYRENSVRRRVAKLREGGYIHRLPRTSRNSVFFVVTALGRQASTVKGHLQYDLLSPAFDINDLDLTRHHALLSAATAAIRVQTGQFNIEVYDRSQHAYRSLTVKGGLNVVSGTSIYDAAKDTVTSDPAALQMEALCRFIIDTSMAQNRSGIAPFPAVSGTPPLTGSHSEADKRIISNHLRRGITAIIESEEHSAIPAPYVFAPYCHTSKGVELVNVVHFGISLPNVRSGNVYSSGSAVAHVDSTSSDTEQDRQATLFHLNSMIAAHAYVAICSDVSLYEKTKQDYSNSLRQLIEAGLLSEHCRDRLVFISYDLINSKGKVDPYQTTADRYAVTPAMG